MQKDEWIDHYYFWISCKGTPTKVKLIKYIGLYGWSGFIYKKDYDGTTYCGEVWLCEDIFGERRECIFRCPYESDMEIIKKSQYFKKQYEGQPFVEINAHTDGYDAFINRDYSKRSRTLLTNVIDRHCNKLNYLTEWFKSLNNYENTLLKLGIQLYLRRLESPTLQTSNEWQNFTKKHPTIQKQIVEPLQKYGIMT